MKWGRELVLGLRQSWAGLGWASAMCQGEVTCTNALRAFPESLEVTRTRKLQVTRRLFSFAHTSDQTSNSIFII
ncbi:hypothetical protein B0T19DRAFT_430180 [Cercophora scortea]|uniref:Uncharacterized protein n=1 Tax=Cercophora scortea TaxID=314031 RepID=A0AAE0I8Q9_9PEZI|nr:hypothetical protein B0T19DRAFT_430180 [Cercophora scortea]